MSQVRMQKHLVAVTTGVVTAVVGSALLAFAAYVGASIEEAGERERTTNAIAREIRHRLESAIEIVDTDPGRARSQLDGIPNKYVLLSQFANQRLVDLLFEAQTNGEKAITDTLIDMASQPILPANEVPMLLTSLGELPSQMPTLSQCTCLDYIETILNWPLVAMVLGVLAILRFAPAKP